MAQAHPYAPVICIAKAHQPFGFYLKMKIPFPQKEVENPTYTGIISFPKNFTHTYALASLNTQIAHLSI
jgi:hypothetical protein